MSSDKKRRLEKTVAALQGRWGIRAIRRLGDSQTTPEIPTIATGFPVLDEALGIGGIPRGRVSEIMGVPTSGMATLALKMIANAQKQAGVAVYIDVDRTFDPDYAARCGVQLRQLVLVRPYNERQALAITGDFISGGGFSVLVFDAPFRFLADPHLAQELAAMLGRIIAPLSQTGCALLFLTSLPPGRSPLRADYPGLASLPHYAAVRLLIQRERWLYKRRDIRGYQAQVQVVKNKLGPVKGQVSIAITFNGVVDGDGT